MPSIHSFSFSLCHFTQLYVMLDTGSYPWRYIRSNPCLFVRDAGFISLLCLDLYVLGDDALIS